MNDTTHENGVLICSIHRTPISKSHGRFFCLKCQRDADKLNTEAKMPDKCTRQTLLDTMVVNVIQTINDYTGAGFSLTQAVARTRNESCAGPAVWERVLAQI